MEACSAHWLVQATKKMYCFTSCVSVKAASHVGQTEGDMTSITQGCGWARVCTAKITVDREVRKSSALLLWLAGNWTRSFDSRRADSC